MSALSNTFRQTAQISARRSVAVARVAQPLGCRYASGATAPHHWEPPHYTFKERVSKFTPTEVYPLLAAVATVSAFAVVNIYWAFQRPEGELRLVPNRLKKGHEVAPWEDERALAGKW